MVQRMRLIVDGALPAPVNMGRDEALLAGVPAAREAVGTLRFYRWDPPAVSLGYFQPIAFYDARADELAGLDLVRRPTGGGAILHHAELTYSLTVRSDFAPLDGHCSRLYQLAHRAVQAALEPLGVPAEFHGGAAEGNSQRGPFFCFARRHPFDLVVGGAKIVGSAQRRRPGAILQHGSIILRRVAPQPCTGVNDRLPSPVTAEELIGLLAREFARTLCIRLEDSALDREELRLAGQVGEKYASATWTRQR